MIDFDFEIKNIQPINIKNMEFNHYRINDDIRKSIILYNKSIAEIKTNNIDIAINDLKRALTYNKGFSEAMKLLGLCYVKEKQFKRAEKTFKKLAEYEIYDDLAKEYIKNLIIEKSEVKAKGDISSFNTSSKNKREKSILVKHSRKKLVIGFSILIIVTLGFTFLVMSNFQINYKKIEAGNKTSNSKEKTSINSGQNDIAANSISNEAYKNMQNKLDSTKSELDFYKNKYDILSKLNEADKSLKEGAYEEAAAALLDIKDINLDNEEKIKFDKLWSDFKTNYIWTLYNQGNKLYKEGKYQEALPILKTVSGFEPSLDLMPWIVYQVGMCYKETSDNSNALVYFQKVEDNYPKSQYASYSNNMIKQIENK